MSNLRKKLIRLAYQKPELRRDLLPLLGTGKSSLNDMESESYSSKYKRASIRSSPSKNHYHDWEKYAGGHWGLYRDDGKIAFVEKSWGGWEVKIDRKYIGTKNSFSDAIKLAES